MSDPMFHARIALRITVVTLVCAACLEAAAQEKTKSPLKQLSSTQKTDARNAVLGEGKTYDTAIAKVREAPPLAKSAVEDFLKKFVFPLPAQKSGLKKRTVKIAAGEREFMLHIPKGYTPAKPLPLIISLHGAGGNGSGEFDWMWAGETKKWTGFVACPSGQPPGAQWFPEQEEFIFALLKDVMTNFNVDTNRVYIHGFSNGGNGAWYYAVNFPWFFGAACPRGGANPCSDGIENLLNIGVYAIHGEKDTVIPCSRDAENAAKLKELGYDVVYVEFPGGGHEPFQKETPKVIEYFNKHPRNPWPKKINYARREAKPVRAYWVEVTKASGQFQVKAEVQEGNKISIETSGTDEIRLHLSDALVDLDKPVTVTLNGSETHNAVVPRTLEAIVTDLRETRDLNAAASAWLVLEVK
ncbi:MAG: dienelactone hydrolase family protein [Planctomycetota bacterium]|nr:dienelactone hydrolase family protein [Planctomycetota bacterium]